MKSTVTALREGHAIYSINKDEAAAAVRFAKSAQKAKTIRDSLSLAAMDARVCIQETDLNSGPMLLGVRNGVLDLRKYEVLASDPNLLVTKVAGTDYIEGAECPQWHKFVGTCVDGDAEMAAYLQRMAGYCLTGSTREQCIFIAHGTGANGKSVFLNVLSSLVGEYSDVVNPSSFMVTKSNAGAPRSDIAKLKGARLCVSSEVEDGQKLNEAMIKQLTGEEAISARFAYQKKDMVFKPEFKIIMACNHLPEVRGNDYAIWRRMRLIPFNVTIPPEKRDKQLTQKLLNELPGILNWALAGLQQWQALGELKEPDIIRKATGRYRTEQDDIQQWMQDRCVKADEVKTRASDLFADFRGWCGSTNTDMAGVTQNKFSRSLVAHGLEKYKAKGVSAFRGIALKTPPQTPPDAAPEGAGVAPDAEDGSEYEDDL